MDGRALVAVFPRLTLSARLYVAVWCALNPGGFSLLRLGAESPPRQGWLARHGPVGRQPAGVAALCFTLLGALGRWPVSAHPRARLRAVSQRVLLAPSQPRRHHCHCPASPARAPRLHWQRAPL